jgi:L-fucose mutarotase
MRKLKNKNEFMNLLKHIPKILRPDLLKILMEMGHGDEIVIADGNFPISPVAQSLVRLHGHGVPKILEAVLKAFPLDTHVERAVSFMAARRGVKIQPVIWEELTN